MICCAPYCAKHMDPDHFQLNRDLAVDAATIRRKVIINASIKRNETKNRNISQVANSQASTFVEQVILTDVQSVLPHVLSFDDVPCVD